jgi:hypothetical protein
LNTSITAWRASPFNHVKLRISEADIMANAPHSWQWLMPACI